MIQFSIIFWAQLTLVGMGALMQLVALFTFTRDPHMHGGIQHGFHDAEENDHDDDKAALPCEAPEVRLYHPRPVHPPSSMSDLNPGKLVKTAKVSFKQRFQGLK